MENQTQQQSTTVSEQSTVPVAIPSTAHSSQNSFLVILLSILLLISVSIAGFFAYQTQKLVKELQGIRNEELVTTKTTPESTTEPVATNNAIPKSISNLFNSINTNFKLNLVPVEENQFYSPSGPIVKKSWKLDLLNANLGKPFATFLNAQLTPNYSESGGIGGGGIDMYENSNIKCFHSYMSQGPDIHNYLSCAEK